MLLQCKCWNIAQYAFDIQSLLLASRSFCPSAPSKVILRSQETAQHQIVFKYVLMTVGESENHSIFFGSLHVWFQLHLVNSSWERETYQNQLLALFGLLQAELRL